MRTPPPRRVRSGDRTSDRGTKPKAVAPADRPEQAVSETQAITASSAETDREVPIAARIPRTTGRGQRRSGTAARESQSKASDVPIEKVAYGLYGLIVVFGWCAMASAYESDTVGPPTVLETSSDAVSGLFMVLAMIWTFLRASVIHLLSLPSVLLHTIANHKLILVAMVLAIAGVYGFVRLTDRVNDKISRGYEKSGHRRRRLR